MGERTVRFEDPKVLDHLGRRREFVHRAFLVELNLSHHAAAAADGVDEYPPTALPAFVGHVVLAAEKTRLGKVGALPEVVTGRTHQAPFPQVAAPTSGGSWMGADWAIVGHHHTALGGGRREGRAGDHCR
jgi:hypothetical protein